MLNKFKNLLSVSQKLGNIPVIFHTVIISGILFGNETVCLKALCMTQDRPPSKVSVRSTTATYSRTISAFRDKVGIINYLIYVCILGYS